MSSTLYNQLGEITRINLGNGTYSTFTYYGLDNSSGYYGKPWQTKTTKPNVGDLQSLTYTWDANGNLTQRVNAVTSETEDFAYDFLDRLTAVSGAYSNSFTYNTIGNITAMNGASYTYGTKPHAVTAVASTSYAYDANGNMTTRGSQTLTWDVENRLVGVSDNGAIMSAVYDGDGNRVKKTEGGTTILYVNQYYEKKPEFRRGDHPLLPRRQGDRLPQRYQYPSTSAGPTRRHCPDCRQQWRDTRDCSLLPLRRHAHLIRNAKHR